MRYDTPVFIRRYPPAVYDSSTGNYTPNNPEEEKEYVNLQSDEIVAHTQDLGAVTEEVITITFQQPPKRPFSSIRYKEKEFMVESSLYPKNCVTFILKEVK